MSFPELPKVALEVLADRSAEPTGFLMLRRIELVIDGAERSAPFRYDLLERRALDAAVIAAHYVDPTGARRVFLRTAVRPPLAFRSTKPDVSPVLWELPAGLIEPGESPREGAARELEEELGFALAPDRLEPLGPPGAPAPGFIGELHFFFHVRVDPADRTEPTGDGHPIEEGARIEAVTLDEALLACRRGELPDTKTELALRRLVELISDGKA